MNAFATHLFIIEQKDNDEAKTGNPQGFKNLAGL